MPALGTSPWMSAAGGKHEGWWEGVQYHLRVPSSMSATLSKGPPRPHTFPTGDLEHFGWCGHPLLLPTLFPIPTWGAVLPRTSGEMAEGLQHPKGLWQSWEQHQGPKQLPARSQQPRVAARWEGAHLSGAGMLSDLLLGSQAWEIELQVPG